jgi:hypothetical protein
VKKDKESVSLFPELAKWKSPEERIAEKDRQAVAYFQRIRDDRAAKWREARRLVRSLPPITRQGVMAYWQSDVWLPREAYYLMGLLHKITKRHESPWAWLRQRRQLYLIGRGRLPKEVAAKILQQ